jgi:S-methylmethionine-dependent homocysteine/selenocysteine methylase
MPNWQFNDVISPEDFVAEARRWRELGATAVGGCCGIGPEHIRLLTRELQGAA